MKQLSIIPITIFIISALSCGAARNSSPVNNPPGYIQMEISPAVIDANTSVVSLTVTNNSEETAQFGANYTIEKFDGQEWKEFERPQFAVIAIMYMLAPGKTQSYDINLFPDQAEYTPGKYRIVKGIHLDITGPAYYTAGFTIE